MENYTKKILIVTTNYKGETDSTIRETGVWLEEFAVPYLVFKDTGYDITVASPLGGVSPVDVRSLSCANPMEWDPCIKVLRQTTKLCEVDYKKYDALFLPGGHGPMYDLANDLTLKEIVEYFYENNKIISAICHGPAGLILAKTSDDISILKGKKVTCFTNKEEKIKRLNEDVPFLLESKLIELGAVFEESKPWSEHVCVSNEGLLITGQNPQSSLLLAEKVIEAFS